MEDENNDSYGDVSQDEWTHEIDERKIKVFNHKLTSLFKYASRNVMSLKQRKTLKPYLTFKYNTENNNNYLNVVSSISLMLKCNNYTGNKLHALILSDNQTNSYIYIQYFNLPLHISGTKNIYNKARELGINIDQYFIHDESIPMPCTVYEINGIYKGDGNSGSIIPWRRYFINFSGWKIIERLQFQVSRKTNKLNYALCEQLIKLIDPDRAAITEKWREIGQLIYSMAGEKALKIWQNWTAERNSMKIMDCVNEWGKFGEIDQDVRTLKYIAKIDSPYKYKLWEKNNVRTLLIESVNPELSEGLDIARVIKYCFSGEFCCIDSTKKQWYQFVKHRWEKDEGECCIRNKIYDIILPLYEELYFSGDLLPLQRKRCAEVIRSIKRTINGIMEKCRTLMMDKYFFEKLDANNEIIGFENGIYNLNTHTLREGRPDDYVSLNTKVNYNKDLTWEHPLVKEAMYIMKQTFPDPDMKDYYLKHKASCLKGGPFDTILMHELGPGANGKSAQQKWMEETFGDYAAKGMPVSILTGKQVSSSTVTPYIALLKGKRICYLPEAPDGVSYNSNAVKTLTGGETLSANPKGLKPFIFENQCKFTSPTNYPPKFDPTDAAMCRRIQFIIYDSFFSDDAPKSIDSQFESKKFPRNRNFNKRISFLKEPLLWILTEYWKKYCEDGYLKIPLRAKEATLKHQHNCDVYKAFFDETYEKGETSDVITINDIKIKLKNYYKDSGIKAYPNSNKIRVEFTRLLGTPPDINDNGWSSWRLR